MKYIPAPRPDFDTYISRADTVFVEREGEPLDALYAQGFLPYSGTAHAHDIFYSARSARIVLPQFELSSENRRIDRKFDGRFTKERLPATDFAPDEDFYAFSLSYFAKKHGERAMPRERLETILDSGLVTHTTIYRSADAPVAYVLEAEHGSMGHYWYSFYDLAYSQSSLGLWLMLDALCDAQKRGLAYYYLGTVYGPKALYKTNFTPLEWWDGTKWNTHLDSLKTLSHND